MSRELYVCKMIDGEFRAIRVERVPASLREPKAPAIHCDTIDDTYSHATGRMYDSKSRLDREAEAAGFTRYEKLPEKTPDWSTSKEFDREIDAALAKM